MKKSEKEVYLDEIVSEALRHCSSLEEFSKHTKELLPLVNKYGDELLKKFYRIENTFLYKLEKQKFILSYQNAHTLIFVPNLYLRSLKTNYQKTINATRDVFYVVDKYTDSIFDYLSSDKEHIKRYVDVFKSNNFDIKIPKNRPLKFAFPFAYVGSFFINDNAINTISNGESIYKRMSEKGKKLVYVTCFKNKSSELCPQYIVESDNFLSDRIKNNKDLITRIICEDTYNEADEEALLEYLDIPTKEVDKWFKDMVKLNPQKKINTAGFNAKLLLTLFVKKAAHELGMEKCKVNMFSYDDSFLGCAQKYDKISFDMRHGSASWEYFVNVVYHELTHLLQYRNCRDLNIDKDNDIDLYSKDMFIEEVFGREYYKLNYHRNSLEVVARYKAETLANKFFGSEEELFAYYYAIGNKEIMENNEFLEKEEIDIEHVNNRYIKLDINGKKNKVSRDLNDLCFLALEEITKYKNPKYSEILEKLPKDYPIILYEYQIEPVVKRKTVEDLILEMSNSNGKDREIYKYLLRQRLKRDKNTRKETYDCYYTIARIKEETLDVGLKEDLHRILLKDGSMKIGRAKKNA